MGAGKIHLQVKDGSDNDACSGYLFILDSIVSSTIFDCVICIIQFDCHHLHNFPRVRQVLEYNLCIGVMVIVKTFIKV